MRKTAFIVHILTSLLVTAGLILQPVSTAAQGNRPEAGLSGTWHTRWTIMEYGSMGTYDLDMTFQQNGNQVSGNSPSYGWQFTGNVSGNSLTGTWSNTMNPQQHPHTFGQFNFTLDSSGRTFSGLYKGQYHYQWDPRFIVIGERADSGLQPQPQPPYYPPTPNTPSPVTPTPITSAPVAPVPSGCSFTGTWHTEFGDLQLTQTGTILAGSYNYQEGKATGTVSGNTATGTWAESPSFKPPYDAGDFTFTLSSNCQSFSGQWRYGSCEWDGDIRGTRVGQPAPPTPTPTPAPIPTPVVPAGGWTNTWDTGHNGLMTLKQSGNTVTGFYEHENGKITGTLAGNKLSGTWSEEPSYRPPDDAGDIEFTLASDGRSFSGRWRYGSSGGWYDGWDGKLAAGATPSPVPNPTPTPVPVPQPSNQDWSGAWDTDWGTMQISQSGSGASGTYTQNNGRLEGRASRTSFTGAWAKAPSYKGPGDAGSFEFTMSADGQTFKGNWKYATCPWDGNWSGAFKRSGTVPAVNPNPSSNTYPDTTPVPTPAPIPLPGVNSPPQAYFVLNPAQPQAGNDISVTSQSTDANGDSLNYTWSRDGLALTQYAGQQKWKWTKAPAGGHVINLTVSDGRGGTDSYSKRIKIIGGTQPSDDSKKKWKIGPFSCFIATAAYGSETAKELDTLRAFRDKVLLKSEPGRWFVTAYYRLSPPLAEFIAGHEQIRTLVRERLLDPVVELLKRTQNTWDITPGAP